MTSTWDKIPGWFDFADLYDEMVERFASGTFVEVGCWMGRSLCYLARSVRRSRKPIKIVAVDTWKGSDEPQQRETVERLGGPAGLFAVFSSSLIACGVHDLVEIGPPGSLLAAEGIAPQSIAFCFVDAAHDEQSVRNDIAAWLPKIQPGGVLAGHDFNLDSVQRAVQSLLPSARPCSATSWRLDVRRMEALV